jgi:hypothetical protein
MHILSKFHNASSSPLLQHHSGRVTAQLQGDRHYLPSSLSDTHKRTLPCLSTMGGWRPLEQPRTRSRRNNAWSTWSRWRLGQSRRGWTMLADHPRLYMKQANPMEMGPPWARPHHDIQRNPIRRFHGTDTSFHHCLTPLTGLNTMNSSSGQARLVKRRYRSGASGTGLINASS